MSHSSFVWGSSKLFIDNFLLQWAVNSYWITESVNWIRELDLTLMIYFRSVSCIVWLQKAWNVEILKNIYCIYVDSFAFNLIKIFTASNAFMQ